jgi:ankyrin repeat protein
MSDSEAPASGGSEHALETVRREAKRLLKQAKAGDAVLLARLRTILPRMAGESDEGIKSGIKLADIQHAIARVRGHTSWRELKELLQNLDPMHLHANRFLQALREDAAAHAHEMLAAHPEIAPYSIHTAAAIGEVEAVARFLAEDRSLAVKPSMPGSIEPLIFACHSGLQSLLRDRDVNGPGVVQLLLDAGASPNAFITFEGSTGPGVPALYFAVVSNNLPVVRMLLERGANPNDGESVFHGAELNHRECLEILLEFGADLSGPHAEWGNTPLYFIAGYRESHPRGASSELGMRWLLEHGADPNTFSIPKGFEGSPVIAEAPLHRVAAVKRSVDAARMLVEHGADVDARRGDGRTPYAIAVRNGNTAVAEYLAAAGADTSTLTIEDRLLAAIAAADVNGAGELARMHPEILSSLVDNDGGALSRAVSQGNEDSVRLMIALGWRIEDEGVDEGTPLHWAAWHGRPAIVKLLLDAGAPVNVRDRQYGSSPIAWAAHGSVNSRPGNDADYVAVVEALLDAGSLREMAYNRWNEPPERLGNAAVNAVLKARGFTG